MSQNKTYASSLQRSIHFLNSEGDLRARYFPWETPPSSGPVQFTYLKCATINNNYVELYMQNLDDSGETNSVATFSYALVNQDVDLYASPADDPGCYPPLVSPDWKTPSIGTGGVVTVVPGGRVRQVFSVAVSSGGEQTLVVRIGLEGAPLKLETFATGGSLETY